MMILLLTHQSQQIKTGPCQDNIMSFFRVEDEELFEAPNFVYAPTYTLLKEEKDSYTYPTEGGWRWFDTEEEARTFYNLPEPEEEPEEEIENDDELLP